MCDYYRFALTAAELDGILFGANRITDLETIGRAIDLGPIAVDEEEYLIDLASLAEGRARLG